MTERFFLDPSFRSGPLVWMRRIDGACGVEVTVGFLCGSYNIEDAVDILFEAVVGIGLEYIACTFDGFIDIGIVEGKSHQLADVPFGSLQTVVTRVLQRIGSHFEVVVAMGCFAFFEGQRDGYFACCFDALAPKSLCINLHRGKGHLGDGVAIGFWCGDVFGLCADYSDCSHCQE